ncbi:hypothetical protein ACO0LB_14590 [Undibacterium sp. SXout7W]|uniref:hypothetical protein n=1 Tax=Undibacterium sp. SXout7W TaxID=3413049 RepID=UPI003BF35965
MSSTSVGRNNGGYTPDFNDLGGVNNAKKTPVMRNHLQPGELAASLPSITDIPQNTVEPLTRFLGPSLTFASPAWIGDPIPRMRALQKTMIAHSLTLEEENRSDLMGSINEVETFVQWNLRFQQMRIPDAELHMKPEGAKKS